MKRSRWMVVSSLVLAVVSLVHGGGDDKEKGKDKLEGSWVAETDGKKFQLTFTKDAFTIVVGENRTVKGTYKTDATKKPKELDMTIGDDDAKLAGKVVLAIYELAGETFRFVGNNPEVGNARATEFPEQEGDATGRMYLIFKRAPK